MAASERLSVPLSHARIWSLTWPVILANVTTPLVGIADVWVMGRMPDPVYIGAVAVGAAIFSSLYWLFIFLRMGTTGLVSQAYGELDHDRVAAADVLAFGYEHSNLSEAVDFAVGRTGTPVSPDPTPDQNLFIRSDQYSFVRQGFPAIWVQAGRSSVDPEIDAQAELDRWIHKRLDCGIRDVKRFRGVAKVQSDGKADVSDFEVLEPVLHDDGHFFGIAFSHAG